MRTDVWRPSSLAAGHFTAWLLPATTENASSLHYQLGKCGATSAKCVRDEHCRTKFYGSMIWPLRPLCIRPPTEEHETKTLENVV
mmetsp:Transcript_25726/g.83114  ORF Transcript_25726/g.83114 Transcript_25726/m.83114 type:complete len:85 (+) Transcript_25726:2431-2685(+)